MLKGHPATTVPKIHKRRNYMCTYYIYEEDEVGYRKEHAQQMKELAR